MNKILISACLLGEPVRYDGDDNRIEDDILYRWQQEQRLVPVCPEMLGGLPVPREPVEILADDSAEQRGGFAVLAGEARLMTVDGQDKTDAFLQGASRVKAIAEANVISMAILTEKSPSCGSRQIYDGSHQRRVIFGQGVTTALLLSMGIRVFSQHQLAEADIWLQQREQDQPPF